MKDPFLADVNKIDHDKDFYKKLINLHVNNGAKINSLHYLCHVSRLLSCKLTVLILGL